MTRTCHVEKSFKGIGKSIFMHNARQHVLQLFLSKNLYQ